MQTQVRSHSSHTLLFRRILQVLPLHVLSICQLDFHKNCTHTQYMLILLEFACLFLGLHSFALLQRETSCK